MENLIRCLRCNEKDTDQSCSGMGVKCGSNGDWRQLGWTRVPGTTRSQRLRTRDCCCGRHESKRPGWTFLSDDGRSINNHGVRAVLELKDRRYRTIVTGLGDASRTRAVTEEVPPADDFAVPASSTPSSGAEMEPGSEEGVEASPGTVVRRGRPRRSERCPGCLARGKLRCDMCSGAGRVGGVCCEVCFGLGKIRCSQCGGTGFILKEDD
ncbi:hypothetical protein CCYA_CCYA16G4055 [Cyanidiococcus yangmingshanensis]|nr:hypothetical protein CCYA_CCYA16G4055 [Cyanidiococcus yangmingshanensis]